MKKKRTRRWFKWQRGQALMEYWPTIPVGVMVMLAAGAISQFVISTILTTTEVFQPSGDLNPCEVVEEEETDEGPEYAQLDCHSVQLVGRNYDEENEQTTAAYKVVSGCDPAISHWTLGIPPGIAAKIISTSEPYGFGIDPTTGVTGIKFDRGYDDGGGEEEEEDEEDEGGPPGGGPPGGGPPGHGASFLVLVDAARSANAYESRTVLVTFSGYFDWGTTEVAVKYGTKTYHSVITAPAVESTPSDDECEM
jgi:hypothetical protein